MKTIIENLIKVDIDADDLKVSSLTYMHDEYTDMHKTLLQKILGVFY